MVSGTVLCPAGLSPGHRESQDSHKALEPLGWTPQMALESGHINMIDLKIGVLKHIVLHFGQGRVQNQILLFRFPVYVSLVLTSVLTAVSVTWWVTYLIPDLCMIPLHYTQQTLPKVCLSFSPPLQVSSW